MSPLSVAIADFNGDGHQDVAVADACGTDPTCISNGSVGILLGNGDGTLQPRVDYPSTGLDTARLTIGDFNGDRNPDVVAMNAQVTSISVFLGKGDGTLQPGVDYIAGLVPIWATVADFNHDRAQDIAVADELGAEVSVFLNSGGTRTNLSSNPNPSQLNQPVTFTATVIPTLSGYGTPTGLIAFIVDSKQVGKARLVSGSATFTTSSLPAGRHMVRAIYSGDSQYNSNFSTALLQVVKP